MSLILEALRKSEQQRRLGEVPTLDSESAWATRRWHGAPARGGRWPWIAAIAVLGLAGGAGWWFLGPRGGQGADPASGATADATSAPAETAPPVEPMPTVSVPTPAPVVAADPAVAPAPAPPTVAPLPVAPPADAPPIDPAVRLTAPTPAVDGEYPEAAAPATLPVDPLPPPPPPPPPAVEPPAAAIVAPEPAPAPPTSTPAPASVAPPVAASPDEVPLVYALPLATRQALPPLRLSMHVWNADPARRFVIVGESRAAEGEAAGTDLTVVEIRRDGVVLEFKGTRFLLPRGGW